MASDLEVLTLIRTDSHLAANHPNACWRSWSAKNRDKILRYPKRTLSSPRLRLEILLMKIINRIGDKGQPWRSPTPTRNVLDFMPRIRTQLSLCLYMDRKARTNGPGTPYSHSTPHRIPRGRLDGQTPMPPPNNPARLKSYSTGPRPGQNPHCSS